jgi:hypothetical protein
MFSCTHQAAFCLKGEPRLLGQEEESERIKKAVGQLTNGLSLLRVNAQT